MHYNYHRCQPEFTKGARVTHNWVRGAPRKDIMDEVVLQATNREVIGKKVKVLRRNGLLPAIIYGQGIDPRPISLDMRETSRIISTVSYSSLIRVEVEGEDVTTLVRDRQYDPVTSALLHVDFQRISLTELLRTSVSLDFSDEAPAVKNFGGILVTAQEQLEIECLPQDLPDRIRVDMNSLEEIGDSIFVRDLTLPPNIEVLTNPDEMVILVTAPAAEPEPEEEEVEEFEEGEEPEVIERGRREDEDTEAEE